MKDESSKLKMVHGMKYETDRTQNKINDEEN